MDYFDHYAERIAQVSADEVRTVVSKYLDNGKFNIIVVAPTEKVKSQLDSIGEVTVVNMPLEEKAAMMPSKSATPAQ